MTDLGEILARLRMQKIEVAGLAADAIERLIASEAEARAELARMREESVRLLALINARAQQGDQEFVTRASGAGP
ncbi:MAG: hypothetical protein N2444_00880 [Methylocystis sp.]|nr:hypothetical protein [Methylocystis sp.]